MTRATVEMTPEDLRPRDDTNTYACDDGYALFFALAEESGTGHVTLSDDPEEMRDLVLRAVATWERIDPRRESWWAHERVASFTRWLIGRLWAQLLRGRPVWVLLGTTIEWCDAPLSRDSPDVLGGNLADAVRLLKDPPP